MVYTPPRVPSVAEDNHKLARLLRSKLDNKAKPRGGLGRLEELALQLGLIQRSDVIALNQPQMLVFAGDHGVGQEKVSGFHAEASTRMAEHILQGGAAINVLARQHGFQLRLVDAGLHSDLPNHPLLAQCKIARRTINFTLAPAMTPKQCAIALQTGHDMVSSLPGNVLALGDIGSGNLISASILLSQLTHISIAQATDCHLPADDAMQQIKRSLILDAALKFRRVQEPLEVLQHFGGFETAMMVGAMLAAASQRRVVLVDSFSTCAAALVAKGICPTSVDYMVFGHRSPEPRHAHMLNALGAQPLLELGLRMGEGVGTLLAWPLVQSAAKFLNEMLSAEPLDAASPLQTTGLPPKPEPDSRPAP